MQSWWKGTIKSDHHDNDNGIRIVTRWWCKIYNHNGDKGDNDDDDACNHDNDDDYNDDDDDWNDDGRVKSVADLESAHITSWLQQILDPKHYFSL